MLCPFKGYLRDSFWKRKGKKTKGDIGLFINLSRVRVICLHFCLRSSLLFFKKSGERKLIRESELCKKKTKRGVCTQYLFQCFEIVYKAANGGGGNESS